MFFIHSFMKTDMHEFNIIFEGITSDMAGQPMGNPFFCNINYTS